MLEGLQGVLCLMDDVLVYGQDQEDHDKKITLNQDEIN